MPTVVHIETARLTVREFTPSDVPAFHAFASDPDVVRHLAFGPTSPAESQAMVDWAVASQAAAPRTSYALAVADRSTREIIGSCGLLLAEDPPSGAETYFVIRKASWGMGYGTEAAAALIDYGFQNLSLHRIWAQAAPENKASLRVLEKLGMTYEGLVRGIVLKDGRWRDAHQYSILEDDPRRRSPE